MRTHSDNNGKHATTTTTGDHPAVLTPEAAWAQGPIHHGRRVWALGEDGEDGYLAAGHDRRALAAINALGRNERGSGWFNPNLDLDLDDAVAADWLWLPDPRPAVAHRWVLIHTTCGCTPAEHIEHLDAEVYDPDWDGCPCNHWGLPPCEPDRYPWFWTPASAATPGAIAVTEVAW